MLLIGNGTVYTGGLNGKIIENGAVAIDDNRIVAVGVYDVLQKQYENAQLLDAEGMLIMPGFINAHEHIYSAFARGLNLKGNSPRSFLEILEGTWWRLDRHLLSAHTYHSAMATYLESIKCGVTAVCDHHAGYGQIRGSLFQLAEAAKQLGVRTCLCYEVSDRDGAEKCTEAILENEEFIRYVKEQNSAMLCALFGLHASFTLSNETLEKCRQHNDGEVGYHIHIAEGIYDQEQCRRKYNMTVVERLQKEGILGPKSLAGHCIHITRDDMELLKESGTDVIHNPESNMGNAVGAPDIITMLDMGIRVGLGTDGYTHDMTESLKVANILQKHMRQLPDRGFTEALTCLSNNAQIYGKLLGETVGKIEEGALADVILVNYQPITPFMEENFGGHLMFGINGSLVDTTIIDGKIVMRHRKLAMVDEEEILARCRESAADLWKSL